MADINHVIIGAANCLSQNAALCGECPYRNELTGCRREQLKQDVALLLERQRPKAFSGRVCPSCSQELSDMEFLVLTGMALNYCPRCGQRLERRASP